MLLIHVLANHQRVHDAKDPGAAEILALDGLEIVEEASHRVRPAQYGRRRDGRHEAIDLARLEHGVQRALGADMLALDACRWTGGDPPMWGSGASYAAEGVGPRVVGNAILRAEDALRPQAGIVPVEAV